MPEGRYSLVLTAANPATTVSASVPVTIDRTVRAFAAAPAVTRADVTFGFELLRPAAVRLDVAQAGKAIASVYSASAGVGKQSVGWNVAGRKDGTYAAVLTTTTEIGTTSRNALFRVDTKPPLLRVLSFRSLRFWVSEPGRITLVVDGARVVRNVRAGAFSYRHGRVRSVRIVARDAAGNLSRTLKYR